MGWYARAELEALGFRHIGDDVRVSTGAVIYRPERISLGDHCRIDDQVMLTPGPQGSISLGRHVYVGPACIIESPEDAILEDFATLAGRVTLYGASDDYLGTTLTNPTVPAASRGLTTAPIRLGRHAIMGAHSVLLPGGSLAEGTAVGAMSLVNRPLEPFSIYVGAPARFLKARSRALLELEPRVS